MNSLCKTLQIAHGLLISIVFTAANMESRDKPLPTKRNETPEWEEEIVAENKDTARRDMDNGGGREQDGGKQKMEKDEIKEGREMTAATAKMKAKKPKAATTEAQAAQGGAPGGNEYILDGFDFSTGTILCKFFLVHVGLSYGGHVDSKYC